MSTEAASVPTPAAWFGKIPAVGDFVSRRLPDTFRVPWERWLEASLVAGAERHGERWPDLYLTFPIWRFVAPAGLLGPETWLGILLPSVDRVGRRFPLTVAEPVASITAAGGLAAIERRLAPLAGLVDDVLDGASLERFEAMLGATEAPAVLDPSGKSKAPGAAETPAVSPPADGFMALTDQLLAAGLGSRLLWWLAPTADGAIASRLLPLEPASFVSLVADDG